jgi:hypothetical protein
MRLIPDCDREVVIDRAMRWLVMYLRSRDPREFDGMNRRAFITRTLVAVHHMLNPPHDTDTLSRRPGLKTESLQPFLRSGRCAVLASQLIASGDVSPEAA